MVQELVDAAPAATAVETHRPGGLPDAADTAGRSRHAAGLGLILGTSVSNQAGAAFGALAFPAIGPVGVVAVRQIVTALILVPTVRPPFRSLRRSQWGPILGLAVTFSVMNLGLYAAVERIGLGLAVTLEFLGPLAVALAGSRRARDLGAAVLAGIGVVVLTNPGPATDVLGIGMALCAAAAWGAYILLNRSAGQRLPGLQGTAAASAVTAAVWLPIAAVWFAFHTPTLPAMLLAAACGVFSSVLPYTGDLLALRRVPAPVYGTVTSVNPVWAALTGWLVLHQALDLHEWIGIGLIVVGNVLVSAGGFRPGHD
ncbi:MAG: EamA family transporter [Gordonia sp. (in: high G+C Gram-positive bacteria)]|uniref:EamA family transporter n=1 Tax=Gordonia sp. (in: high G+C Gram-positive bacteria) TaxID=84139 RepID=UPI0039E64CEF